MPVRCGRICAIPILELLIGGVLQAHREAVARGDRVAVVDGIFVAIDVVLMAERTLAIARRAGLIKEEKVNATV